MERHFNSGDSSSPGTESEHEKVSITVIHTSNNHNRYSTNAEAESVMNSQQKNLATQKELLQLPPNLDVQNRMELKKPVRDRRCNSMHELSDLGKENRQMEFSPIQISRRSNSYHGERFFGLKTETNLVDGLLTTDLCSTEL